MVGVRSLKSWDQSWIIQFEYIGVTIQLKKSSLRSNLSPTVHGCTSIHRNGQHKTVVSTRKSK